MHASCQYLLHFKVSRGTDVLNYRMCMQGKNDSCLLHSLSWSKYYSANASHMIAAQHTAIIQGLQSSTDISPGSLNSHTGVWHNQYSCIVMLPHGKVRLMWYSVPTFPMAATRTISLKSFQLRSFPRSYMPPSPAAVLTVQWAAEYHTVLSRAYSCHR